MQGGGNTSLHPSPLQSCGSMKKHLARAGGLLEVLDSEVPGVYREEQMQVHKAEERLVHCA